VKLEKFIALFGYCLSISIKIGQVL